jgi:hypothetical protein
MKRTRIALALFPLAFACLAGGSLAAEGAAEGVPPSPYSVSAKTDWRQRELRVEVRLNLAAAGLKMPGARLEAERMTDRDVPGLAKAAVLSLQADSYRTIGAAAADGTIDAERIAALAGAARAESAAFTADMREFVSSYVLGLDAVSALFLTGARPSPIRAPLEELATRDYTGIVIYARGELPVRGEGLAGKAAPCLFPRIYDEGMRLLLDRTLVEPEVLAAAGPEGGVLGYAAALGPEAGARVGGDPMRVMAVALFGDDRTDYVISREDALRILSSPADRELLRRGRVVVVLGD